MAEEPSLENKEEDFFNFLLTLKAHDDEDSEEILVDQYDIYHKLFNPKLFRSDILSECMDFLVKNIARYENFVGDQIIQILGERFV